MNNISQRDAFWNKVYELAKTDRNIVVVSADMGAPALDSIRKDLAGQFVNVGIAEQNAITVAAGLALGGKKVFAYAIAPFITLRCFEQIRVECGMMKLPITIVGVGAGFGYEDSGPTHHIIEDIAVMRSIPHFTVHSVTDNTMAQAMAEVSCRMTRANYVRLERQVFGDIYPSQTDFSKGMSVLKKAKDHYILSTGSMTHLALDLAKTLENKKIDVGVIDIYTFPICEDVLIEYLKGAKKIVTLEEHFLAGGLGSSVCEVLCDHQLFIPVKRLGLPMDKGYCYQYGGREAIRQCYGLDKNTLEKESLRFFTQA